MENPIASSPTATPTLALPPAPPALTMHLCELISEQHGGKIARRVDEDLMVLIGEIIDKGKKGSITIKLDLVPEGPKMSVLVTHSINPPKETVLPGVFYTDPDSHRLVRKNPRKGRDESDD